MFDSIKAQLFTPSSIIIAIIYHLLMTGALVTYDTLAPAFNGRAAVVAGKGK
jgi:hypothetical protein